MPYITHGDLKLYLGVGTTGDDALLESACAAAQKEIESYCGRQFLGSTGTRYYREQDLKKMPDLGPGTQNVLWLGEDLLSVSTFTNGDDTAINSTSYWLEPRNEPPYQWIRLRSDESWVFNTDGEVSVAGTWGYSTAVPLDVRQATLEMAAYLYRLKDSQTFDVTAAPDIGVITVPQGVPRHVRRVLDDGGYRRRGRFA